MGELAQAGQALGAIRCDELDRGDRFALVIIFSGGAVSPDVADRFDGKHVRTMPGSPLSLHSLLRDRE